MNGNINYIQYPTDYLDQFCGHSPNVRDKPKAFYPRLDEDLKQQQFLLYTGFGLLQFQPYTLCVEECPKSFSLADPIEYGGLSYPGANSTDAANLPHNSFYVPYATQELYSRCLPVIDNQPELDRELCAKPGCNDPRVRQLETDGIQQINCTVGADRIDSTPDVSEAWVVDSAEGKALCEFEVKEVNKQTFLPPGATAETRTYERQFAEFITLSFTVLTSVTDSWVQIGVMGVAAPFAFAFVWFLLLFLFAGLIIILALILFLAILVALCIYLYIKAGWTAGVDTSAITNLTATLLPTVPLFDTPGDISQTWYAVFAVIATILVVVYIILILLWRTQIVRAIAIVKETTKVFKSIPFIVVWPMVGLAFSAAVLVYAVAIGSYIATSNRNSFAEMSALLNNTVTGAAGVVTDAISGAVTDPLSSLDSGARMAVLMAVHVVGVIWALFITAAALYATLSRTVAVWFFSHGPNEQGKVVLKAWWWCGFRVVFACAWCIFYKHLGSIAFGAAIMTIVKIIKIILEGFNYYTKDLQDSNLILKVIVQCSRCCVWCLERTVQFITYFGFVFVAIEGTSFCSACWKTMGLWVRYPAQITVNKMVAHLLSVIISLSIPTFCGFITWVWCDADNRQQPFWPAIVTWVVSFFIASSVTDVFRCAIDTLFICAFKDLEDNGTPNYMSEALQEGFGIDRRQRLETIAVPGGAPVYKTSATSAPGGETELARP